MHGMVFLCPRFLMPNPANQHFQAQPHHSVRIKTVERALRLQAPFMVEIGNAAQPLIPTRSISSPSQWFVEALFRRRTRDIIWNGPDTERDVTRHQNQLH